MLSTNFVAGVSHPAHTGENGGTNFCEQQDANSTPKGSGGAVIMPTHHPE